MFDFKRRGRLCRALRLRNTTRRLRTAAWLAVCAGALAGVGSGCTALDTAQLVAPEVINGSHGGKSYRLYVPSGYRSGTPIPIVLMLHGCLQGAAQFAQTSRMDALAEAETFLALYPEQSTSANPVQCWLWYDPGHQERGRGEPAFFVSLIDKVRSSYSVDAQRIYMAGFSAGGAMGPVLAAAYSDVFAAVAVGSGMEYKAATSATAAFPAMSSGGPDPVPLGRLAYRAMGTRARVVPTLVFHGGADRTVATKNGDLVLSQMATTNDLADNAVEDRSISDTPSDTQSGSVPGGRSYKRTIYKDRSGQIVMEKYIVDGMVHAWSGGNSGSYGDPGGPDASKLAWEFFKAHPMGSPPPPRDGGTDGGPADAGADLPPPADMRPDAATDAGTDAGTDMGPKDGGSGSSQTFTSIGAEDGYAGMLFIDGASNSVHKVGDKGLFNSDSYRLILSFDTSTLPATATVRGARVRIVRRAQTGTVKMLLLSVKSGAFGSAATLAQEDHAAAASQLAIDARVPPAADGQAVEFTIPASALVHINKSGRTQFRIAASTAGSLAANQLSIYGGEDGANAPTLTIDY